MASSVSTSTALEIAPAAGPASDGDETATGLPDDGSLVDLEVDDDGDSAYVDDYESFTTSINSTDDNYVLENGRRYHSFDDRKYPLPNDDDEINRLELQHQIWRLSLHNRISMAPIPPPAAHAIHSVLDIGCGTGAWAIDFAEMYPNAHVIGMDLSAIQPHIVPPNVEFLVDDFSSEWLFAPRRFDYIHSRSVTVGVQNWTTLVDQVWRNLTPGGWVEFDEYHMPMECQDGTMAGSALELWNDNIVEASKRLGAKLDGIFEVPRLLRERGFVGAGAANTKWALGPWPKSRRQKKIGTMFQADILGGLEGITMRLFKNGLGWEQDAVLKHLGEVSAEINAHQVHTFMPIDIVWAQKPVDATD